MVFFSNAIAKIYEYGESNTSFNVYGEPDEMYTLVGEYNVDFQPLNSNEVVEIEGTITTNQYKMYLPWGTPITGTCRVMINKQCYEIIGEPEIYNHLSGVQHIKCILMKHRI